MNKNQLASITIGIILFFLIIIYFTVIREKFTNQYITDTMPYDTEVKKMVSSILKTFNKQYSTEWYLIAFDRVNTEIVDTEHLRYNMRVYVHNKRMAEGRNMLLVFTVSINKQIKVEHINISNSVNLPNNIWTNKSTRNGIYRNNEGNKLMSEINGIEQTDIDYQPVKINGHCIRNTQDFYKSFVPTNYNEGAISVNNKYAVSFAGIIPFDNPTVARQEKLSYEDPMSSLFKPSSFDGADGNIAY
jgi:hypothetical protein